MIKHLLFLLVVFKICTLQSQATSIISGVVEETTNRQKITNAEVMIEGSTFSIGTNDMGEFSISTSKKGQFILNISAQDFVIKRIPIFLEGVNLDLGTIRLEQDITFEKTINLVNISDDELLDDEVNSNALALLQSTKDIFLNRAAFDFGQAFFRVRGYDSQYGEVSLNGIPMNKMYDGRPQWNNWGGFIFNLRLF